MTRSGLGLDRGGLAYAALELCDAFRQTLTHWSSLAAGLWDMARKQEKFLENI